MRQLSLFCSYRDGKNVVKSKKTKEKIVNFFFLKSVWKSAKIEELSVIEKCIR